MEDLFQHKLTFVITFGRFFQPSFFFPFSLFSRKITTQSKFDEKKIRRIFLENVLFEKLDLKIQLMIIFQINT